MNKEIKEIKEILDYISDRIIPNEKWDAVKDYITNLQQENKQLKEEKDTLYNALITTRTKYNNDKARYRRKAKRYKQKIDKANSILTELEEWIKQEIDDFKQDGYDNSEKRKDSLWLAGVYDEDKIILDKIQELKEKYK